MADTILPHALPEALDGRGPLKILSLDCFDTLLWRDTHAPADLFGALSGLTVPQRQRAEGRARTASALHRKRNEVSIEEIYRELLPNGTAAEHAQAVAQEIEAEAAHCFAFAPTVALMREAKRRGCRIVIVSDTYLGEAQLRGLIAAAAGEDVAGLIDRLFCSSVYGKSKREGLYELVLKELGVKPDEILHIGDNPVADVGGVAPFGVQTLHLKQFSEATEQRLRLEAAVSTILHPGATGLAATHQPHRATLAAGEPRIGDPGEAFGFSTLGPVLHGFDRWLRAEAEALQAAHGGRVHLLFLMRDGHLPRLVHTATQPDGTTHAIEISRFTAQAAALSDEAAVRRYIQFEQDTDPAVIARQLLLPPGDIALLTRQLPRGKGAMPALLKEITTPARMRRVLKNAAGFADRLVEHVRSLADPAPGDTLMLIDLGYNGTVQNHVEPLLRARLGVHVAGRYLLMSEHVRSGLDKRGFLDQRHYDAATLDALSCNVAVLEQLCTAAQGSVVDYRPDGTPIRRENSIKARQSEARERIQAGCVRFAREAQDAVVRQTAPNEAAMWRRASAAALARLMFLPLEQELAVVSQFEHDVNLGVDNTVALFDPAIARRGLRQRGLFYMNGSERMYLPAELHGESMALKLSLLANRRFDLPLRAADFADHSIALPVLIADGRAVSPGTVAATPTHDGYYVAPIPIGDCRFSVGLQFGKLYDWLQIESAVFMPVERFLGEKQRCGVEETGALPTLEGMEQAAPHLFRCEDEHAFMMVPPPARCDDRPMMLAVTFRPIAPRPAKPDASPHLERETSHAA